MGLWNLATLKTGEGGSLLEDLLVEREVVGFDFRLGQTKGFLKLEVMPSL